MNRLYRLCLVLALLALGAAAPASAQGWCSLCAANPDDCIACCRCAGGRPAECAIQCEGPDPQPFAPAPRTDLIAAGQCAVAVEELANPVDRDRLDGAAPVAGDHGSA